MFQYVYAGICGCYWRCFNVCLYCFDGQVVTEISNSRYLPTHARIYMHTYIDSYVHIRMYICTEIKHMYVCMYVDLTGKEYCSMKSQHKISTLICIPFQYYLFCCIYFVIILWFSKITIKQYYIHMYTSIYVYTHTQMCGYLIYKFGNEIQNLMNRFFYKSFKILK